MTLPFYYFDPHGRRSFTRPHEEERGGGRRFETRGKMLVEETMLKKDYKVLRWPDKVLKQKSKPVDVVTPEIIELAKDMVRVMEAHHGVGLSAIQIGIPLRLVVSHYAPPMINPEIIGYNIAKIPLREGCLSLPNIFETVDRYPSIQMVYGDLSGMYHIGIPFSGIAAQCFQHELEHLDGHFFTDHLPKAERSRIQGEVQKLKRAGKWTND